MPIVWTMATVKRNQLQLNTCLGLEARQLHIANQLMTPSLMKSMSSSQSGTTDSKAQTNMSSRACLTSQIDHNSLILNGRILSKEKQSTLTMSSQGITLTTSPNLSHQLLEKLSLSWRISQLRDEFVRRQNGLLHGISLLKPTALCSLVGNQSCSAGGSMSNNYSSSINSMSTHKSFPTTGKLEMLLPIPGPSSLTIMNNSLTSRNSGLEGPYQSWPPEHQLLGLGVWLGALNLTLRNPVGISIKDNAQRLNALATTATSALIAGVQYTSKDLLSVQS